MPSGAASLLASARRSRIWPQRETIGCCMPASTARTSAAGWRASEPAGRPPSLASITPTRSIDRRAAGGISNFGFSPSNSSRSSVDMASSSSSVGRLDRSRSARGAADCAGSGWTISPAWLSAACCAAGCSGAAGAGVRVARGVGVGEGAGLSKPGGSRSTGASCASTIAELSASAAPPRSHADFIALPLAIRLPVRSGAAALPRHRPAPRRAIKRTAPPRGLRSFCRSSPRFSRPVSSADTLLAP